MAGFLSRLPEKTEGASVNASPIADQVALLEDTDEGFVVPTQVRQAPSFCACLAWLDICGIQIYVCALVLLWKRSARRTDQIDHDLDHTDQIDHDLDHTDQIDHDVDHTDQIDHDLDHLNPRLPL